MAALTVWVPATRGVAMAGDTPSRNRDFRTAICSAMAMLRSILQVD